MVSPDVTVGSVLQILQSTDHGSVLVQDENGTLVGIFTERDAIRHMAEGLKPDQPIRSLMTTQVATLNEQDTVETAVTRMARNGYRRLPVVGDSGKPSGLLNASHVLRYLVDHIPATIYNLPPEPNQPHQHREGA